MALESEGGAGAGARAKRRRVDEQGGQRQEVAAGPEAAPVVRISALPDDVRRRILTRLPLKDAIRSAALAQGWRDLWKSRWAEPISCLDFDLLPCDNPRKVLSSLESVPRRRLDRFSFVVDNEMLRQPHLKRFLAYAAECRVEDLHVEVRRLKPTLDGLIFHLPLSSRLLAHLSLRNIKIFDMYYKGAQPFYALEAIHLHSVGIGVAFRKVMALCPRLHTLDLRRCNCDDILYEGAFMPPAGANLKRVTVAQCGGMTTLRAAALPSLRSFRYSNRFLISPFFLPKDAALTDLYICFSDRVQKSQNFYDELDTALPDNLSGLSVLTICSSVLKIVSSFLRSAKMNNLQSLQSLRELQLLMLGMEMDNLSDIYHFLKGCHCSNLERLFVQLSATSDVPLEDLVEEVRVELPEDGLVNLRMVKIMNFNWRRFEVQLVSLLLRKATSLHKLLLVSPNVAPQHVPGVQEADLFLLKEALASGRIIVSKSDDPATQPFHSEVFIKV